MAPTEKLKIIEGTFSTEDAKDILMNLFVTKIQYHEMREFSSQERFGKSDPHTDKRIRELKTEVERLNKIIAEAQSNGNMLRIASEIQIEFTKD